MHFIPLFEREDCFCFSKDQNLPQWLTLIVGMLEVGKKNNLVRNRALTPEAAFLNLLRYYFTGIIFSFGWSFMYLKNKKSLWLLMPLAIGVVFSQVP